MSALPNLPNLPNRRSGPLGAVGGLVYPLVKTSTGLYLRLLGITVVGAEHLPISGGALVAANHITNLDPFAVAQGTGRQLWFMGKKELFSSAFGNWFYSSGNVFPVDRARADPSAIKTTLRLLQAGEVVLIFPQGTRGGKAVHDGIGFLALRAKVPVVPVGISRRGRGYRVVFGPPLAPTGTKEEATAEVMAAIGRLIDPS